MLWQMVHYSAVGFLAVTLCLFACLSANGTGDVKQEEPTVFSKEDAESAVEAAKTSTNKTCVEAQSNIDSAKSLLEKVETLNRQADAVKDQADLVPKDNNEVETIVNSINSIYNMVKEFCTEAKEKINGSITSLGTTLKSAKLLKDASNIEIPEAETAAKEYTTIQTNALGLKKQAEDLDNSITQEVGKITEVQSTAQTMEENAKEGQLKNSQARGIVAVAKIQTMIEEADSISRNTQSKKIEVIGIVKEMQSLKTKAPSDLIDSFDALIKSANGELKKVTDVVKKVEQAQTKITVEKGLADDALTKVKAAEEVSNAEEEVTKAEACVVKVTNIFAQLTRALKTATISVRSANVSKQEMVTGLSKTTSKPSTEKDKKTEKTNLTEGNGAEPHQKDTKIQSTITNTEQGISKDALDQSNNSADKLKETLSTTVQNVPTTALTGGKAPAPGAKNDSAMTVSVPLLVALIASAVWQ